MSQITIKRAKQYDLLNSFHFYKDMCIPGKELNSSTILASAEDGTLDQAKSKAFLNFRMSRLARRY